MKLKINLKVQQALVTRMKFRYTVTITWYARSSFFYVVSFIIGKEFQAGSNEPARVIASTYTVDCTNILSGGPAKPNAYWVVTFLNPKSGYLKIDAYLQILCHMTSDVKLSHYFILLKVKQRSDLTLKSFRKQFQCTNHSVNAEKLLRLSIYHCKLFLF